MRIHYRDYIDRGCVSRNWKTNGRILMIKIGRRGGGGGRQAGGNARQGQTDRQATQKIQKTNKIDHLYESCKCSLAWCLSGYNIVIKYMRKSSELHFTTKWSLCVTLQRLKDSVQMSSHILLTYMVPGAEIRQLLTWKRRYIGRQSLENVKIYPKIPTYIYIYIWYTYLYIIIPKHN